jgi:hypothetical protein
VVVGIFLWGPVVMLAVRGTDSHGRAAGNLARADISVRASGVRSRYSEN